MILSEVKLQQTTYSHYNFLPPLLIGGVFFLGGWDVCAQESSVIWIYYCMIIEEYYLDIQKGMSHGHLSFLF